MRHPRQDPPPLVTSPEHVRVFVPTRGQVRVNLIVRLDEIKEANPALPPIRYEVGTDIISGRNGIVHRFLADPLARVLVMIDDDVEPHINLLDGLALLDEHGVVGFPYPLHAGPSFKALPDGGYEWVGTGCIAVHRDVLEALGGCPFRYAGASHHDVGRIGISHTDPSEDVAFCWDARAAGFTVGVAHDLPAHHFIPSWRG